MESSNKESKVDVPIDICLHIVIATLSSLIDIQKVDPFKRSTSINCISITKDNESRYNQSKGIVCNFNNDDSDRCTRRKQKKKISITEWRMTKADDKLKRKFFL